jgi:probable rRNA maturation factor
MAAKMNVLLLFNRQKTRKIRLPLLRRICRCVLDAQVSGVSAKSKKQLSKREYEIGVHLVGTAEITRLNETFLHHHGPTDVITFDYGGDAPAGVLSGEIFISVDEAIVQAQRFATQWQSELVRYFIHGLLHLEGHDDCAPGPRKKMKVRENRLLKDLSRRLNWGKLEFGKYGRPTK